MVSNKHPAGDSDPQGPSSSAFVSSAKLPWRLGFVNDELTRVALDLLSTQDSLLGWLKKEGAATEALQAAVERLRAEPSRQESVNARDASALTPAFIAQALLLVGEDRDILPLWPDADAPHVGQVVKVAGRVRRVTTSRVNASRAVSDEVTFFLDTPRRERLVISMDAARGLRLHEIRNRRILALSIVRSVKEQTFALAAALIELEPIGHEASLSLVAQVTPDH